MRKWLTASHSNCHDLGFMIVILFWFLLLTYRSGECFWKLSEEQTEFPATGGVLEGLVLVHVGSVSMEKPCRDCTSVCCFWLEFSLQGSTAAFQCLSALFTHALFETWVILIWTILILANSMRFHNYFLHLEYSELFDKSLPPGRWSDFSSSSIH